MAVLLLLALAVPLLFTKASAAPGQTAILRCRLEQTTIATDAETAFVIEVLDVSDFYGYELTVKYNSERVKFVDADPDKAGVNFAIGDFLAPDFVVVNTIDNSKGDAQLALTQLSPNTAVNGSGELARANVIGVGAGFVNFSFSSVVLSGPSGNAIPVELQNCNLEVTTDGASSDASLLVEPDFGATLVYTDTAGLVTIISVPAGAVTDTITLRYNERPRPLTAPADLQFAGVSFSLEAFRNDVKLVGYVFKKPIQLDLEYAGTDVVGVDEANMMLYFLVQGGGGWSTDGISPISRDTIRNRLIVSIEHLTEFASFAPAVSSVQTGVIDGEVYEDLDRNGSRTDNEPGVFALVKLYLIDSERQWSTLSRSDGNFSFIRLPDGTYFVEITPLVTGPFVYTTAPPTAILINIENGSVASGYSFGLDFMKGWVVYLPKIARLAPVYLVETAIYLPLLTGSAEAKND